MIKGFSIVCISTSDWEQPWGSRQQIMNRLSRHNRILFVEYQMSFFHILKFPRLGYKIVPGRSRHINNNLTVYRPFLNFPFGYYFRPINLLNQYLLLVQLKKLIKELKFSRIILWTFEPTAYYLVGKLNKLVSIYHCIDSFKDEKQSALRRACIGGFEERLSKTCDLILSSTEESLIEKSKLNKNTYLIPSAVNEAFFNLENDPLVYDKMSKISEPRIGFVGTLDGRVDIGLVDFITDSLKNCSFLFIGPIINKRITNCLSKKKNVYMFGFVNHKLLPFYIKSFDVGIIPYKVNSFTQGISPIKVFEYLSLGKPVVATELKSLKSLSEGNLIETASSKVDFLRCIKDSLSGNNVNLVNSRIEFAKANTWGKRVAAITAILDTHLANFS